jgi:hypothetical protein
MGRWKSARLRKAFSFYSKPSRGDVADLQTVAETYRPKECEIVLLVRKNAPPTFNFTEAATTVRQALAGEPP